MIKKVDFFYLTAFSLQGGIEKFNRAFILAMSEIGIIPNLFSLYDGANDIEDRYVKASRFSGLKHGKWITLIAHTFKIISSSAEVLFVGHINMAFSVFFIRLFNPRKKIVLIAHGTDIWQDHNGFKRWMIRHANQIWVVSNYSKKRLIEKYPAVESKVLVFPNTIDPYFPSVDLDFNRVEFNEKYELNGNEFILLTVARLNSSEGYKGYDRVIQGLSKLKDRDYHYFLVGKYDKSEKERLERMINEIGFPPERKTFTGFVSDLELIAFYQSADTFVMPSEQEGFGIVYLEALACGTPVIAGNRDGSVDALANGELGTLVDPLDVEAIATAIQNNMNDPDISSNERRKERMEGVRERFSFEAFKKRLKNNLENL